MNVPPYGDTFKRALMQFANLKVKAQDTPDMTVNISAGGFWYYTSSGASFIEYAGGNSGTITAPGSPNNKWVLVTINASGTVVLLEGSSGATPSLPALPRARFPLAAIYITYSDTTITEDMIYDVRPAFEMSVTDHRDLQSTSVAAAHPGTAITFAAGGSGMSSTNINDAILELKTLFDDLYVHAGSSGTSGTAGSSGTSGSGSSGTSGSSGSAGSSGTSGSSGSSGSSGTAGSSGTSV
jgi:hypothetical protein